MSGTGAIFIVALLAWGCQKEPHGSPIEERVPVLPEVAFGYSELEYPDSWLADPAMQLFGSTQGITVTDAGATLGRVLFYDTELSSNREVSCAAAGPRTMRSVEPFIGARITREARRGERADLCEAC